MYKYIIVSAVNPSNVTLIKDGTNLIAIKKYMIDNIPIQIFIGGFFIEAIDTIVTHNNIPNKT